MYADLELLWSVYRPDGTFKYYIDIAPGEGGGERKWDHGIMGHEMTGAENMLDKICVVSRTYI